MVWGRCICKVFPICTHVISQLSDIHGTIIPCIAPDVAIFTANSLCVCSFVDCSMLMPKKNRVAIYEHLFKEGVMVAKKDFHAQKHPELETVPNLHVIKALTVSLKTCTLKCFLSGYVETLTESQKGCNIFGRLVDQCRQMAV